MYLHDWEGKGWFDVVMEFEGIYMTEAEFRAPSAPYANARMWEENKAKAEAAMAKPEYQGIEVLLASYSYENYSGDAFVLFRKGGKLYEVNGGHCSCYGLEGQWSPEETAVDALMHRLEAGHLGKGDYDGNEFAKELRDVISGLSSNVEVTGAERASPAKRPCGPQG